MRARVGSLQAVHGTERVWPEMGASSRLLEEDAYGVAIRETIEARTGRAVSSGAIYTALGRLEERGLVSSRVGEAEGPGRPRKYYALEKAGARALLDAYSTMRTMASGLIPRLARLAEK